MIQDRISQVAFGKQVSIGSPAASGDYVIGVNSGAIGSLEINEEDLPISWSSRLLEGHDRSVVIPGSNFETLAMPKSIGALLVAACGDDAVTPGTPNSHLITGAVTLPYITIFARREAETYRVADCRVSELEFSWENTKALTVKVTILGCTYTFDTAFAGTTDERPVGGVLKGAGGTFTVNGSAVVAKSGTIKISNNVEAQHGSASPEPVDVFPAMQTVDVSLTLLPADLTLFRTVVTGTAGGTTVQAVPEYGTCVLKWQVDADTSLQFNAGTDCLKFMTEFPDVKAEGGPVEVALEGSIANRATPAYSFTLRNSVAAEY